MVMIKRYANSGVDSGCDFSHAAGNAITAKRIGANVQ